jgi:hypothetical protein
MYREHHNQPMRMLKTHFGSLSFQVPQPIIKVQAGFLQVPIANAPSPNLTTLFTTIDNNVSISFEYTSAYAHWE